MSGSFVTPDARRVHPGPPAPAPTSRITSPLGQVLDPPRSRGVHGFGSPADADAGAIPGGSMRAASPEVRFLVTRPGSSGALRET